MLFGLLLTSLAGSNDTIQCWPPRQTPTVVGCLALPTVDICFAISKVALSGQLGHCRELLAKQNKCISDETLEKLGDHENLRSSTFTKMPSSDGFGPAEAQQEIVISTSQISDTLTVASTIRI